MSGCGLNQFADVLRPLGYESFEAPASSANARASSSEQATAQPESSTDVETPATDTDPEHHDDAGIAVGEGDDVVPAPEDTGSESVALQEEPVVEAPESPHPEVSLPSEAPSDDVGGDGVAPAEASSTEEVKLVTLWRLAPRQTHVRSSTPQRAPREWTIAPASRPERPPPSERPTIAMRGSAPAAGSAENEERARRPRRPDGPRPQRAKDLQPAAARPAPNVDKDSPFYKLMALRGLVSK